MFQTRRMTSDATANWDGDRYAEISGLQQWVAEESLSSLTLADGESVLDMGCGDGRITAALAGRTSGAVLGVDRSPLMVSHASQHHQLPNLDFQVGEASTFRSPGPFDRLVSFNALHWLPEDQFLPALQNLAELLEPRGRAHLRLVCSGETRSLEDVAEDISQSSAWSDRFPNFRSRFYHPYPQAFRDQVGEAGFTVERLDVALKSWDFGSRDGFRQWAQTTFVPWTGNLGPEECAAFIDEVLDRYPGVPLFRFYQLVAELRKG